MNNEELEDKIEELKEELLESNESIRELVNKRASEIFNGIVTMFVITWIAIYFK